MANWSNLKTTISNIVKSNGTQAITGNSLQSVLLNMALLASPEWSAPEQEIETVSTGEGTKENPYQYDGVMPLVKSNYYIQDKVTYVCTRSLYEENSTPLKDLIGMYVKEAA